MSRTRRCFGFLVVSATAVISLPGCGKKISIDAVAVSGAVTLDGQPLADALVTLNPLNPDGKAASGRTDAAGQFKVSTFVTAAQATEGAIPGDYAVTVSRPPVGTLKPPAGDPSSMSKEQLMQMSGRAGAGAPPPQPAVQIPPRYADPQQSGLKATIVSGNNPPLQFPLTSK